LFTEITEPKKNPGPFGAGFLFRFRLV